MATFCLLHGNWHDGSSWDPLLEPLRRRGHEVLAPDLIFDDPEASFEERVRPALEALEGKQGPVVIVGHSGSSGYAAFAAHETPGSLLVYLCARLAQVPAPDGAPEHFRKGFPFPPADADGVMVWDREAAIEAMYPRLPPETARALADRLQPGAPSAEYPLEGHPDVQTALIYTTDDEFFEPDFQRFMAREALGIEPIELPGGHFPMVEDPERLADQLDLLAREVTAS
jgi:pimeloyl-ACP methyl ester carboxylesterase